MSKQKSVSFDQAAGYYDRTRAMPDELRERLIPLLVSELPGSGRCLEVGVGTGRIGLSLAKHGVRLFGIDLSREMLKRLVANYGASTVPIVQADATRLPFDDATFFGAVAAHVLHLIPDWTRAVDEIARVLNPGGVLLVSRGARGRNRDAGTRPDDAWDIRVVRRFFAEAGDPPWPPGLDSIDDLAAHLGDRAEVQPLPELFTEGSLSITELLAVLEAGYWAACWTLDERARTGAVARTREWAVEEFGDLDEPRPTRDGSYWHVIRLRK